MERRSKRPRRRGRALLFLLALGVLAGLYVRWGNTALQASSFSPVLRDLPQGFDGCRLVVLGDLHSTFFGEKNQRLLEAVEAQEPEYIFLVGDLLDAFRDIPPGYAEETAAGLARIAPTYYVTGNHEWAIGNVPELKQTLEAQGVTVLSNQFVTLERNGDTAILAGIDDPNGYADQKTPEALAEEVRAAWGDPFWMLLAHRNDHFPDQYSLLEADLVISGHGHPPALHRRAGVHGPDLLPLLHGGALCAERLHAVRHPGARKYGAQLPAVQPAGGGGGHSAAGMNGVSRRASEIWEPMRRP